MILLENTITTLLELKRTSVFIPSLTFFQRLTLGLNQIGLTFFFSKNKHQGYETTVMFTNPQLTPSKKLKELTVPRLRGTEYAVYL